VVAVPFCLGHGVAVNSRCLFTLELYSLLLHIRIGTTNPTVRTRKHEVVSCSVAVSNNSHPLKPVLPKKRSAYAKKPSCFHPALSARNLSAEPDAPKQPLI
jgi:hypothetical protein